MVFQKKHVSKDTEEKEMIVYQPTDIVLAKVKGYPAWPAMIIPSEIIPPNVLKSNSHSHLSDEEDEMENGDEDNNNNDQYIIYSKILKFKKFKKHQEVYCVKFFKDDSYIWVKGTDLQPLTLEDCQAWLEKNQLGTNKRVFPAYEMACDGFRGNGIDVWEFVEYGSKNRKVNAGDEEYTEDDQSQGKTRRSTRNGGKQSKGKGGKQLTPENPTRVSARQRKLREKAIEQEDEQEFSEEEEKEVKPRATRKRNTRSHDKPTKKITAKTESVSSRSITPPKKKAKTVKAVKKTVIPKKPVVVKYNYEDDEDWVIVGMGTQDYEVTSKMSTIASKLSQKKNVEKHNETKLDLADKLLSINKLLVSSFNNTPTKEEYEVILDELDIAWTLNGSKNEFISTFRSNNELLINFRILFNLKLDDLQKFNLYDNFQETFDLIYDCPFIPDLESWSKNKVLGDENVTEESASPDSKESEATRIESTTTENNELKSDETEVN